ncbi:NAD-dependent DNA ligase [Peptoniphilus olsenii]|uniref:NAD-dependent DNA ligase n=1 Tax=Peptoniphilus olsenii TaxID=411570 RepID=A0ABV2J764_9FIRM
MTVKELKEELAKYDDDYEIYGNSYIEDDEFVLEILNLEEGIDSVYIVMQDMV